MRAWIIAVCVTCTASSVFADRLTLSGGKVYEGEVIQETDRAVVFRLDHGVITVQRDLIASIDKTAPAAPAKPATAAKAPSSAAPAAVARPRLQNWDLVTTTLARQPWATNFKQIPSTVIDKGSMRFVPYGSYWCGEDYEVNVYGDPDHPACVEIGVYRSLLTSDRAKRNCIDFIASVLGDSADVTILRALKLTKDLVTRDGLSIEITPETDEDAYGGWWVSAYSEKALDAARATDEELKHITVTKNAAATTQTASADDLSPPVLPASPVLRPARTVATASTCAATPGRTGRTCILTPDPRPGPEGEGTARVSGCGVYDAERPAKNSASTAQSSSTPCPLAEQVCRWPGAMTARTTSRRTRPCTFWHGWWEPTLWRGDPPAGSAY